MDIFTERQLDVEKNNFQGGYFFISELERDLRTQIRTQILYKTLLKRYAPILLNFSGMDIPSEVKEYVIPITLKIDNSKGIAIFEDHFEWDILNESNK